MQTDRNTPSQSHFVIALIFFALMATTGVILLIATLVFWLSALTGSPTAASLIVCGLSFIAATTIYLLSLRGPIARMQDKIETVYEVAQSARDGYRWISRRIAMFLRILDILRS